MGAIGIGIIGCGKRLQSITRLLLKQTPDLNVVALYDPSQPSIDAMRRAANCPDARVCESYQTLVGDPAVNWVMVGSWNCFHREHAVAALDAGKHVFCEKPLATTLQDALAIRQAYQRSNRRFVIGFTLRYTPHYRRIHQLIRDGLIGQIISFEFNETLNFNHGGFVHQDWRRHTRNAGTHLLEKCCHDIDVANWLVGSRATCVASFGGNDFFVPSHAHLVDRVGPHPVNGHPAYQNWQGKATERNPFLTDKDIVDNQVAIIQYANGVRATFHTNCNAAIPERRAYILGSEGAIRADLLQGRIEVQRIGWDEPQTVYRSVAGGHGGGDEVMTREVGQLMHDGADPSTTLDDGLAAAITCFGIDQAMQTRQTVDLTPLWDQAGQAAALAPPPPP